MKRTNRVRKGTRVEGHTTACFCTGQGKNKDKRQCHLCRDANIGNREFKEIGGHVYCPSCFGSKGIQMEMKP